MGDKAFWDFYVSSTTTFRISNQPDINAQRRSISARLLAIVTTAMPEHHQ